MILQLRRTLTPLCVCVCVLIIFVDIPTKIFGLVIFLVASSATGGGVILESIPYRGIKNLVKASVGMHSFCRMWYSCGCLVGLFRPCSEHQLCTVLLW